MAARLGLTRKDVVDNVVTALTSNGMIAPSYWIDPKTGNNYFLTVQYTPTADWRHDHGGLQADSAARQEQCQSDHAGERRRHQDDQHAHRGRPLPALPRDRCVCFAEGRRSGRAARQVQRSSTTPSCRRNVRVQVRGSVVAMQQSFKSFGDRPGAWRSCWFT